MAKDLGQGTAFTQVKGLELYNYDLALQTMALGFAVGSRGQTIIAMGAYEVGCNIDVTQRSVRVSHRNGKQSSDYGLAYSL